MGREVREVAEGWEHPKGDRSPDSYNPMFESSDTFNYETMKKEWDEELEYLQRGEYKRYDGTIEILEPREADEMLEDHLRYPPNKAYYMPNWPAEQRTHIQMYENTSEGTPISPVFKKGEEEQMARWLADNGASAMGHQTASFEHWYSMITGSGFAVSGVISGGRFMSGVEAVAEMNKEDTKPGKIVGLKEKKSLESMVDDMNNFLYFNTTNDEIKPVEDLEDLKQYMLQADTHIYRDAGERMKDFRFLTKSWMSIEVYEGGFKDEDKVATLTVYRTSPVRCFNGDKVQILKRFEIVEE